MRINGPNGPNGPAPASAPAARRTSSASFTLATGGQKQPAASAGAPRAIGGIEALLALQGVQEVQDPAERRKRAVTRGRTALDVLDELKIGLLAGTLDPAVLARLKSAASGLVDGSGDPGLDAVLAEIELRVEVELAKMAPAPA